MCEIAIQTSLDAYNRKLDKCKPINYNVQEIIVYLHNISFDGSSSYIDLVIKKNPERNR